MASIAGVKTSVNRVANPSPKIIAVESCTHQIDVIDPSDEFSAADSARLARQAVHEISTRGRLPVVAGGTGRDMAWIELGPVVEDLNDDDVIVTIGGHGDDSVVARRVGVLDDVEQRFMYGEDDVADGRLVGYAEITHQDLADPLSGPRSRGARRHQICSVGRKNSGHQAG